MCSSTTIDKLNKIKRNEMNNIEPEASINCAELSKEQLERMSQRSRYCMILGIIMMLEPTLDVLLPLSEGDPGGELFEKNMKGAEDAVRIPESVIMYVLRILRDIKKEDLTRALDDTLNLVRENFLLSYAITREGEGDGA